MLAITALFFSGCAVHYYDKKAGTEHLWGFGHMKMRAVPVVEQKVDSTNGAVAFVTGVRTAGLSVGTGQDYGGLTVGFDSRSRIIIKGENTAFYLLWPQTSIWLPRDLNNFFTVRIGTNVPDSFLPKKP